MCDDNLWNSKLQRDNAYLNCMHVVLMAKYFMQRGDFSATE